MFDEEGYRKLFVEESRENHENIVNNLLALENEDAQQEAIDEIFRSAHTLKGMSASMGFDAMEHLCHSMEDVFSLIRSGRREVTVSLTDLLLNCTDTIEEMLDAIEAGGALSDEQSASLVQDLQVFAEGEDDVVPALSMDETVPADLLPETMDDVDGQPLYTLTVAIDPSSTMKDVRAMLLLQNLEEIGTIRSTIPPRELLEDGKFDEQFEIFIESEAGEEALRTIASGTEVSLIDLSPAQSLPGTPAASSTSPVNKESELSEAVPAQRAARADKRREIKNIRVDIQRLDRMMNLVEDLVINRGRLEQIA